MRLTTPLLLLRPQPEMMVQLSHLMIARRQKRHRLRSPLLNHLRHRPPIMLMMLMAPGQRSPPARKAQRRDQQMQPLLTQAMRC